MRYRIRELFSQEILDKIREIDNDPENKDNNMKGSKILFLLKDLGFVEIGSGTNRLTVRHIDYVYKIALDSYGVRDNWCEFNMSPELQPYVTKTYETNGIIAVAQYANLITKQEFIDSMDNIRSILEILSENYIFCDMGLIPKNYCNYGFLDTGELVILDFAYIYKRDPKIMFCRKCGSPIRWNKDFTKFNCIKCGREHDPIDIRDRMWKSEDSFHYEDTDIGDNDYLDIQFEM